MNDWIMVVPKNRSLKACKEIVKRLAEDEGIEDDLIEVRGEDVAFFVKNLLKKGKKAVGVTGEDLFQEWEQENYPETLDIIRRYEWRDKEALFGRPVLCLLGPKGKTLKGMPKKIKLAISNKYKELSKQYITKLEERGYKLDIIYLAGSVEEAFVQGIVDLIIDIVYTGKSAEEAGLECYEVLFESDIVVIGNQEDFKSVPKIAIKR